MGKTYTLYTYFGSSCSARVRIAAHLKGIEVEHKFINLLKGEQLDRDFLLINPSHSVPTLIVSENGEQVAKISQSLAILEFLEETEPDTVPLLPPATDPMARAKARELANIIACDVQPVTNLRIVKYITPHGIKESDWQQHFMTDGLRSYEKVASGSAGKFSVGDSITIADIALVAAVDRANRFHVDVSEFPTISRVDGEMRQTEAYQKGNWRTQADTPDEYRQKL